MARYVLAARRARLSAERRARAEETMQMFAANELRAYHPSTRKPLLEGSASPPRTFITFEADPEEMALRRHRLPPDLILEEEIEHEPARGPVAMVLKKSDPTAATTPLVVTITGAGAPLPGAIVQLVVTHGEVPDTLTQTTGSDGTTTFHYDTSKWTRAGILVTPAIGYWSMMNLGPDAPTTLDCPALPPGPLGWWHRLLGERAPNLDAGRGIRIGVVDTGVGPNPDLSSVIDLGSLIGGVYDPTNGQDLQRHGTHVCGVIAAMPEENGGYVGLAPGASVYSIRVFPANGGSKQTDVAGAIDMLVDQQRVDLINLSLASVLPSAIEHDSITAAFDAGVLCVAAAGNDSSKINYPAAFAEVAAVSALGQEGWGPPGSVSASAEPTESDRFGNAGLFLASFSSFGAGLTCTAPGVGVISTMPAPAATSLMPYADDAGTSVATPASVAVLAARLATDATYASLPRTRHRATYARKVLIDACTSVGLARAYQGNGAPAVSASRQPPRPENRASR